MRHYDIIIGDDLVTDENSDTEGQRKTTHNWFYKTLLPCLEPDGKMWIIGTRWHADDLYGWLEKEDYVDSTFVLGVLDVTTDESMWEEKFPTARMHRIRKGNLEAFELQYQQNATGGHGGIFNVEHFRYYEDLPASYFKWQAADLATGERARNDYFAHVTGARDRASKGIFLVAFREMKIQFPRQVKFIGDMFDEHPDTMRVVIEANAYQVVMAQQIRETFPHVPVIARWTLKDKITRANQLATIATYHPFYIRRQHHKFLRRMLAFPNGPKDLFDAFEMMVGQALQGARKKRRKEPGLI
jgi:phage terminase large subunit-like protein